MAKRKNDPPKMDLINDTESGMLLSMLADEPGEAEAAMVLNSLVDNREDLNKDAEELIEAVENFRVRKRGD